jgi:threonine aldolase
LIELPQREIGGQPSWKDLVAQVEWAHKHGAPCAHGRGAAVWECGPFYSRPLSDIAALFDTVYVRSTKAWVASRAGCCSAKRT